MSAITPQFNIGDKVKRVAFTDCFGRFHREHTGLVVSRVRFVEEKSIPSYYCYTAEDPVYTPGRFRQFEGAECFFEAEAVHDA